MNKEFILLSESEALVSDTDGNIIKREYDNRKSIEETLLIENKIEKVYDEIYELKALLASNEENINIGKKVKNILFLSIPSITLLGFLLGGLSNINTFIESGLSYTTSGLVIGLIIGGAGLIFNTCHNHETKNRINAITSTIQSAEWLALEYEKELANQKNISNQNEPLNKPISLENKNRIAFEKIDENIYRAFENAKTNKPKSLILTKKLK